MIGDLGADDFDRLIEAARRAVEAAQTEPPALPDVRHEAADPEGMVRATAVLTAEGPRLQSLRMNPRARRLDSGDLAELLLRTVNEALDGVSAAAGGQAVPNLAALSAELHELQQFSADRFGVFADTIGDVLRQLDKRIEG